MIKSIKNVLVLMAFFAVGSYCEAQQHTIDSIPKKEIYLNIDYKQLGVGGDNSFSNSGLAWPKYRINSKECSYGFTISPTQRN